MGYFVFTNILADWFIIDVPFKRPRGTVPHVVVVVTRPLLRIGDMAEDHGASKTGELPRALTRGRRYRGCKRSLRFGVNLN